MPGRLKLPTVLPGAGWAVCVVVALALLLNGAAADFDGELDQEYLPFTNEKAHLQKKDVEAKESPGKLFEFEEDETIPKLVLEESAHERQRRQAINAEGISPTAELFIDMEGSGTEEPIGSGTVPPTAAVAYYRINLLVTNVRYTLDLGNRLSAAFRELAENISREVDNIYQEIPGTQFVTVLQFLPRDDGYIEAYFDLGSEVVYSEYTLRTALEQRITGGQLGELRVSPDLLQFSPISVPVTTTQPVPQTSPPSVPPRPSFCRGDSDFRCTSGECIPLSLRCNGGYDCADGSDERACLSGPPCRFQERYCDDGLCYDANLQCDGIPHCRDASDEKPSLCGTDVTPPVIRGCPFRVGATVLPGQDEGLVSWTAPSATDDSGKPVKVVRTHSPYSLFPVGRTTVVYSFTDASGNQANCSFIVTVVPERDRTPPDITGCPSQVTGTADPGTNEGIATWTEPTATDNDGRRVRVARTHIPSTLFPVGPTTVRYIFTDSSENRADCEFIVTIEPGVDTTPPRVTGCPERVFGVASPGENEGIATWDEPIARDNDGQPVRVARTHAPLMRFPLGPTRVEYYFTDTSGNQASCIFNVEIRQDEDTTPPKITGCPQTVLGFASPGENEGTATWEEPVATDNDGQPVRVARTHTPSMMFPLGPTRVVYIFTDTSGNKEACEFYVVIRQERDETPPEVIGCPPDIFETLGPGENEKSVSWVEPTATDNDKKPVRISKTHEPGSRFRVGETKVKYFFADLSGNANSCLFFVTLTRSLGRGANDWKLVMGKRN